MDRKTRIEENEKLFREVNERVEQMRNGLQVAEPQWVCECGASCWSAMDTSSSRRTASR